MIAAGAFAPPEGGTRICPKGGDRFPDRGLYNGIEGIF